MSLHLLVEVSCLALVVFLSQHQTKTNKHLSLFSISLYFIVSACFCLQSLWQFASSCKLGKPDLSMLPMESNDPRRVMRNSLALYRSYYDDPSSRGKLISNYLMGNSGTSKESFYSNMYLGLLLHSEGGRKPQSESLSASSHYFNAALATDYGKYSINLISERKSGPDFMVSVVKNLI